MLQCLVDGISHRGEGIGRIDGIATFIPNAIPGETVSLKITEKKRRFQRALLERVLEPSPHRIEPPCPYYFDCGGCAYQHMSYEAELKFKRQVVSDNLKHIGGVNCEADPVTGMESPWRYRNKVTFHLQNLKGQNILGYFQSESHKLIQIDTCLLINLAMQKVLQELKKCLNQMEPLAGQIMIRQDYESHLLVLLQTQNLNKRSQLILKESLPVQNIMWQDRTGELHLIKGQPWLDEKIGSLHYRLSPLAFFQVNRQQCQVLYEKVKSLSHLDSSMQLLDAYCGTGTISLYLASDASEVLGVESFAPAVEDARFNARLNGINNCQFHAAPCEVLLPELNKDFDLVVLDPPRAGCSPQVLNALIEKSPSSIIYVSCNPATLARDLKIFNSNGYDTSVVQPIDMFPRTYHVETVVVIERR